MEEYAGIYGGVTVTEDMHESFLKLTQTGVRSNKERFAIDFANGPVSSRAWWPVVYPARNKAAWAVKASAIGIEDCPENEMWAIGAHYLENLNGSFEGPRNTFCLGTSSADPFNTPPRHARPCASPITQARVQARRALVTLLEKDIPSPAKHWAANSANLYKNMQIQGHCKQR